MADYMVGRGGGGKDRYMVGWNGDGKSGYKVGGGGKSMGQASNSAKGGGDQASPAGEKSAFAEAGKNIDDIGDRSDNMNFGGAIKVGLRADSAGDTYAEKGDWSTAKDAMARRAARMAAASAFNNNGQYETPTASIYTIKNS